MVRSLPAVWKTHVQSLGQEHPVEKEMATYSSIFTWKIPWTEESMGSQTVGHDWATLIFFCLFVCLFLLWWARLSEVVILYADDSFVFCFVCCLDEAFCTGCYWWLGSAESCIQVVSFVWVLSMWYFLTLALWLPRVLEWVLPLQRLRAWSLCDYGSGSLMRLPWNWLELQSSKGLPWAAEPNCRQAADPRTMKKQSVQGSRHST